MIGFMQESSGTVLGVQAGGKLTQTTTRAASYRGSNR
jgi:hypothetical protein